MRTVIDTTGKLRSFLAGFGLCPSAVLTGAFAKKIGGEGECELSSRAPSYSAGLGYSRAKHNIS